MISKELIKNTVLKELSDEYFIVSISVTKNNKIDVLMDGDNGISIQKCIDISRSIEQSLDRDAEDFELSVSSPGLGKPLKVYRQFVKNIGQSVEVNTGEDKPVSGTIKSVDEKGFELEVKTLEKVENKKKKVEVVKVLRYEFDTNPTVKNIISFK